MLKNYFLIAVRSLLKNKVFSAINILGLSIGISASLVIYLLVNYHFSFDKFEKDSDRIYRVVTKFDFSGEIYRNSGVPDPMADAVKREFSGLTAVIPFRTWNDNAEVKLPKTGNAQPAVFKKQKGYVLADSNYFNMVEYKWLAGSAKSALIKPYNIVLAESLSKTYFPSVAASETIGREIIINDTIRATVTGVVKDLDQNSDFSFKAFMAYTTLESTTMRPENWLSWNSTNGAQQLYVKLSKGTTVAHIEKQLAQLYEKHKENEPGDNSKTWLNLQPLSNIHFDADYGVYENATAHMPTLYGLLAIAAFLLILGCINFINLTTAHAAQRAKEIGIRKTMGSTKGQLIIQFLSETFLLTLTATLLSIALTPLILKAFSGFIPANLHFSLIENPGVIVFLAILLLVVTFVSGFYPAMVLSGYKPVLVLKNQAYSNTGKTRKSWLRKSLTVSQFVIAQVFIMGAILVSKQITYSINKDLGFKKDAIVYFHTNWNDTSQSKREVLLQKLRSIPEAAMVSRASNPPSSNNTWSGTMKYKDGKKEIETNVQQKYGDTNYIKLYKLKLIAGKNIEQTDTVTGLLINKTYAGILGFADPAQAIGKTLEWNGGKQMPIVGVIADFHEKSLHEQIKPLMIGSWKNVSNSYHLALLPQLPGSNTWKTAATKIEKAWKEVYPNYDFELSFYDQELAKYYDGEQKISKLLMWSTGLAIFISCLGLLGLVIYTTTQRTKEIGVRKVLGASVPNIVAMISKEFVVLVVLAFAIAAPLAWYGINKWLENFAYRTTVSWWIFAGAGVLMIAIALLTLGFQTIKAAMANPVKSLRTE